MIKDILVNLSYGTSQDGVSNYAYSVAETFGAHIVGIAFAYPAMAGGVGLPTGFSRAPEAEAQERADSVAAAFDEAARRAGVSAETRRIEAGTGDVPTQFAHIARRFDLSVVGQFEGGRDHSAKNMVIEATLFESGRPVLIVPVIQKDRLKLDHVMVCWDGSRAAARAVADAMPFLTRSGKASIVVADIQSVKSTDLPGADIATHLTRHGVNVTIERIPVSKIDVSNAILSYAADTFPDLIVMGGYGHSRLREFILGGTTRGMLASMTKPTLMSH
ncbi:universal stress protein [Bradyrhizobium sp. CCGUVB1N3]|uniref:universal stress protein n=1 Tax=Bradyrhizobium sp. CCGUVB1N3 TaxID=2949629 RepID=UPI0020B2AE16|nr:universal stress protein [Bradyrhizobium sp. CCGUVB1N3]MCP3471763.1 universal stress protein [Bradyrhizobium sp. CCGUVB1N3]